MTDALLQANTKDGVAHYLRANAQAQLGQPTEARKSAARAYRFAVNSNQRFEAAQLAARLAVREDRPGLAQLWLRRTAIHSPTDAADAGIARDYNVLRRINPWSFRFNASVRPSDNVNNGANSPTVLINGEQDPFALPLSGTSLALSGVIGTLDARVGYKLRENKDSQTTIGARLHVQRVRLSDSAREQAPTARNGDFAFNYAEASLAHAFRVGSGDQKGTARVGLDLGTAEFGGARIYDFLRISGSRDWRISPDSNFTIAGNIEERNAPSNTLNARIHNLQATWRQGLGDGDRLDVTFGVRDSDASSVNGTSTSLTLRALYTLGRKIGPTRIQAGLGFAVTDYPAYQLIQPVPGGREDQAWNANIDFVFDDVDYAGFAPRLSIRAGNTDSNISRFTTEQLTVTLGFASKF